MKMNVSDRDNENDMNGEPGLKPEYPSCSSTWLNTTTSRSQRCTVVQNTVVRAVWLTYANQETLIPCSTKKNQPILTKFEIYDYVTDMCMDMFYTLSNNVCTDMCTDMRICATTRNKKFEG